MRIPFLRPKKRPLKPPRINLGRSGGRKRPEGGGEPALVEPPDKPIPLQGGAAAALEFDDER